MKKRVEIKICNPFSTGDTPVQWIDEPSIAKIQTFLTNKQEFAKKFFENIYPQTLLKPEKVANGTLSSGYKRTGTNIRRSVIVFSYLHQIL